ncbi:hypothetical protein DICPUDRAFT_152846 [Dictyostelium purpureum]|uniref:LRR containing protein n=1 Tax=Dictyostelium purpureum TaxID=5786 RepID=F0ZMF2_DICPU|nr:uncharacterized protein DICPUDRAFT_152846 [Dictyostelium purpureum]EGC34889.1 hypothetical protein DICPUDRAFT_152846 [Dictyostelium purpureum]|eukprot:XP_003288581.1 hypothetical protein DICPUDRAFT_152846 [Dictyostelium purpureum]
MPFNLIPNSVMVLYIKKKILMSSTDIPDSIKILNFDKNFTSISSTLFLNTNIVKLTFGRSVKIAKGTYLPKCLEILHLNHKDQCHLLSSVPLPESLHTLILGDCTENINIPKTINFLVFVKKFKRNLPKIPINVSKLKITDNYKKPITKSMLPLLLEVFQIGDAIINIEEFRRYN